MQDRYGVKGGRMLTVPRPWTPEFVLISAQQTAEISHTSSLSSLIDASSLDQIKRLAGPSNEIYLRSSVIGESIWDRGTYRSVRVNCLSGDFSQALDNAATEVIHSAPKCTLGFLIQRYVPPTHCGQFGNLLRISKTRDHWEVTSSGESVLPCQPRLNSQRDQASDPSAPLVRRTGHSWERLFGSIGAWLNSELMGGMQHRVNCEWVVSGDSLYIVQVDTEDEDHLGTNPFQVRISATPELSTSVGNYLKVADTNNMRAWDKLKVLDELWESDATRNRPSIFCGCQTYPILRRKTHACGWRRSLPDS